LALGIHNAKLYEAARRSQGEIAALHSLTIAATQSLDLDVVLKEAIHKVTEIFHFDATRIFLFNAEMTELHVKAAFEFRPESWNEAVRFRRGESIIGTVAETGESFIFDDIVADPRYLELTSSKSSLKAQARFLGMFPIKTKLKIWGVMVCVGKMPRTLDPAQVELLRSMTNQIGTVLQKTMREILQIFGFDAARIYLRQGSADELELVAHEGMPENLPLIKRYRTGEGRLGKAFEPKKIS
jgi:signal transduction protein with GAF and PtsI domain